MPPAPLPPDGGPPALAAPAPPGERVRRAVAGIESWRGRAAAPGLADEERDALADHAWAALDEVLGDPGLRDEARRTAAFLRAQALLLLDDGADDEAFAVLERLGEVAPEDPETHYLRGLSLMGLERPAEAAGAYRRALALGVRGGAGVRAHLAYATAAAGAPEEGLAECLRAAGEDPREYLVPFVRGWILGELGRGAEARAAYAEAVGLERDDADLWWLRAEAELAAGNAAGAAEAWREVVRIDPSDAEAADRLRDLAGGR